MGWLQPPDAASKFLDGMSVGAADPTTMSPLPSARRWLAGSRFGAALLAVFAIGLSAHAADVPRSAATGTVEGRVFNPGTGEYLEFVRITVEGTALETFTDSSGEFRLANVPAGAAKLMAFRTGVPPQTISVAVAAGQVAQQNIELSYTRPSAARETAIKLDAFVVGTSKQMDGAAIAINTQRFAANTMNVVAANEFGPVADGGVGEVLKSVPGVAIARGGFGDAYQISINGTPPRNVPITVGGISLANSASGLNRFTGMQQSSINNFSRIEIIYTPTPETSAAALAGTVNMVPLSAFERSKPVVNVNVSMMMRDNDRSFRRTPGPLHEPARKVQPGSDFSAIVPVNDRFGFTFSGSASALYMRRIFRRTPGPARAPRPTARRCRTRRPTNPTSPPISFATGRFFRSASRSARPPTTSSAATTGSRSPSNTVSPTRRLTSAP